MQAELNDLVEWFESDEVNLDEAIDKYEQAARLIKEMEAYLVTVKNKVDKITAKFDG